LWEFVISLDFLFSLIFVSFYIPKRNKVSSAHSTPLPLTHEGFWACLHRHCVFTIPEELRVFFLIDRNLLNCLLQKRLQTTNYLNRHRIDQAKELLDVGMDTIGEIASATGFNSQQNFIRVFKKHMGKTPGQYRSVK
jgi:AraC-like DNA-binding protein